MWRFWLLAFSLAACDEVIAPEAHPCEGMMGIIRQESGPTPDAVTRGMEDGGVSWERWAYARSDGTHTYVFRWGGSFESCRLTLEVTP